MNIRRTAAALTSAAALSITGVAMAAPAHAQPVVTGGFVNVTIVDFADVNLEDITVQVPIAVAANLCDLDITVLAADLADDGVAQCDATARSVARR